jgi:2-methylisocitrate lyase-like PEP mutase family enzyme
LRRIPERLDGQIPLMANMVEGGQTPIADVKQLQAIGYSLVIFPGGIVRALARSARDYYASLARHGSNQPFRDRMFDFNELNEVIGTPDVLALGVHYAGDATGRDEDDG